MYCRACQGRAAGLENVIAIPAVTKTSTTIEAGAEATETRTAPAPETATGRDTSLKGMIRMMGIAAEMTTPDQAEDRQKGVTRPPFDTPTMGLCKYTRLEVLTVCAELLRMPLTAVEKRAAGTLYICQGRMHSM